MDKPHMEQSNLKYFLYARKSSENEDRQVASIPSQITELKKLAAQSNLQIVEILTEEKSAKSPGRPIFSKMVEDIKKGKAQGIICWKLDRLARNPIDGGAITWMLQQSVLKHIQSYQRSYYPTDNFLMISMEFGMSNQFVLDLIANTKRGMRSKAQNGWIPHKPPIGYLNNRNNPNLPPIYKDPERFQVVRSFWDSILKTRCSVDSLYFKAKAMGTTHAEGTVISRTKFHEIFKNPFYYGYFRWGDDIYQGKHEPMVTKAEYDLVQDIIRGKRPVKLNKHVFAFTGMIQCPCGAAITAETKTKHQKNGNVHKYTYYRCSRRIDPNCSEPPIRDSELEIQILDLLDQITIPPEFHQWAMKYLREEQSKEIESRESLLALHRKRLDAFRKKLDTLVEMRLSGELSSEEYLSKKQTLLDGCQKAEELLKDDSHRAETWLDRAENLFQFAETAKKRFEEGDLQTKKEILSCLGTNFELSVRTLRLSTRKPLVYLQKLAPEVQALHRRLEPLNHADYRERLENLYASNPAWGG